MFNRRTFLAFIASLALCAPALAQPYPSKVIKIIAPYTPGSPNDVMVRLLAQHAQQRLGQPIIIDNRPGGGTSIGTKVAAASAPDGYTLLFISSALVTDPAMRGIDYDPMKDFTPVAAVTTTSWLFAVVPSLPVKTMKEFIAYTKANPGTVMLGYAQGTAAVLLGERYKQLSGADITSIPYKGGAAAMPDFLGGRIQMLVPTPSTTLGLIREGKMRILGITSGQRSADLPEVPTVKELGLPELELYFWAGVLAPAGTPPEIVNKLNAAINDSLKSDEMKSAMTKLGFEAKVGSPQDFANFIGEETPRWRAIVKATGVKLE